MRSKAAPQQPGLDRLERSNKKDYIQQQNKSDYIQIEGDAAHINLHLTTKVDSAPEDIYEVLTSPETDECFRNIKCCTHRQVLKDDKQGRRHLHVGHRAIAKFLFISITFDTQLLVWQDDNERTIRFCNARDGGFMRKFEGRWHIRPFCQRSLDEAISKRQRRTASHTTASSSSSAHSSSDMAVAPGLPWLNTSAVLAAVQRFAPQLQPSSSSLVTLEQNIQPRSPLPPGISHLVRGLCAKQVNDMMEDLRKELKARARARQLQDSAAAATSGSSGNSGIQLKGKARGAAAAAAAPAACMTLAQPKLGLWDLVTPINITIQL